MNATSLAAMAALSAIAVPVAAQEIVVTVDGEVVPFSGQRPIQLEGNTLVPLRGVFEKLGADVFWDAGTRTVTATRGAKRIQLRLGQTTALVDDQPVRLAVPPQTLQGSTMVPLRFVSEALGAQVQWRAASRTVVIRTDGAAPTTDPPVTTPMEPEVTELTYTGAGRMLRAGDTVTVTLRGTPGSIARYSIPGIPNGQDRAMTETDPGVYTATFTVPDGFHLKGASLLASLTHNGHRSPVIQASAPLRLDSAPPTLAGLTPAPGAVSGELRPLIYGTLSDGGGSGIDSQATKLVVNGKDVTDQATFTEAFFSYKPAADLATGRNSVVVVLHDQAGNEARKTWEFTVQPAESLIKSVTVSPKGQVLEPGDVLTVRMEALPGGEGSFQLGAIADLPMREQSAGVYVGTYTVRKGDSLAGAPVTVKLSRNGRTATQAVEQAATVAGGKPEAPVFTSPATDESIGAKTVVLTGRAAPGATVHITLGYKGKLLILPTQGALREVEVKANARGIWKTDELTLEAPLGVKELTYWAQAYTVGAAGETSEPATVRFKR